MYIGPAKAIAASRCGVLASAIAKSTLPAWISSATVPQLDGTHSHSTPRRLAASAASRALKPFHVPVLVSWAV